MQQTCALAQGWRTSVARKPRIASTRRCSRCGEVKPLAEFHRNRTQPLGRRYACRACTAAYAAEAKRRKRLGLPPLSALRVPMAQRTERRCTRCGRIKPAADFVKDRRTGGPKAWCRACENAYHRAYRRRKLERHRELDRRKWHRRKDKAREYERLPRVRQRKAARQAVFWSVRSGHMDRPETCQRCGAKPLPHCLHGHHPDYAKPLEVVWLCSLCHGQEHRKTRDEGT